MKKTQMIGGLISLCVVLVSGCGNSIPEMDEETHELVVEYAAATVRKHNTIQNTKLMDYQELEEAKDDKDESAEAGVVIEAEVQEEVEKDEQSSLMPDSSVEVVEKTDEEVASLPPASLDEFLQLEGVGLSYEGYEVRDYYPEEGDELFFVMNATEGNQLLVLKFKLQNLAQEETLVDLISKNVRYKIEINGETKNALTTMLLNDLSNYQGNVAAGAEEELVLVCEIPKAQTEQIDSLSIIVKNADETATISLN